MKYFHCFFLYDLNRSNVYAAHLEPEDSHSPWAPVTPNCFGLFEGITTVDQLIRAAIAQHGDKEAVGSRMVIITYNAFLGSDWLIWWTFANV